MLLELSNNSLIIVLELKMVEKSAKNVSLMDPDRVSKSVEYAELLVIKLNILELVLINLNKKILFRQTESDLSSLYKNRHK